MQAKIKALEKLIAEACVKIQKLEKENSALKSGAAVLEKDSQALSLLRAENRELKAFRESVLRRVRKLSARVEKELQDRAG